MIDLERLLDLLGAANIAIDLAAPCKSTYTAYWKLAQEELLLRINQANGKEYDYASAAFAHFERLRAKCATVMCEVRIATEFWIGYEDGQHGNNASDDPTGVYAQGNDFGQFGEYINLDLIMGEDDDDDEDDDDSG